MPQSRTHLLRRHLRDTTWHFGTRVMIDCHPHFHVSGRRMTLLVWLHGLMQLAVRPEVRRRNVLVVPSHTLWLA
jgi:hypothetical protein